MLKSFGFGGPFHFSLFFLVVLVFVALYSWLPLAAEAGAALGLGAQASPCRGFSCCGALAAGSRASVAACLLQGMQGLPGPGMAAMFLVSTRMNSLLQLEQFRASIQSVHIHPGVNSMRTPTNRNKRIG